MMLRAKSGGNLSRERKKEREKDWEEGGGGIKVIKSEFKEAVK